MKSSSYSVHVPPTLNSCRQLQPAGWRAGFSMWRHSGIRARINSIPETANVGTASTRLERACIIPMNSPTRLAVQPSRADSRFGLDHQLREALGSTSAYLIKITGRTTCVLLRYITAMSLICETAVWYGYRNIVLVIMVSLRQMASGIWNRERCPAYSILPR